MCAYTVMQHNLFWLSKMERSLLRKFTIKKPLVDMCEKSSGTIEYKIIVGFEVFTAFVMKRSVWDITPYSPFIISRHFGRKRLLHLRGRRISQARNQLATSSKSRVRRLPEFYVDDWFIDMVDRTQHNFWSLNNNNDTHISVMFLASRIIRIHEYEKRGSRDGEG
jgi:hypothetical protein